MLRNYTCIICPNGCEIEIEEADGKIIWVEGAICEKGKNYVQQELTHPMRTIATTVLVRNGELSQTSVRLTKAIPKENIFDVMNEIKKVKLQAPVKVGDIAIKNVLGLDSDVIVTKPVEIFNR